MLTMAMATIKSGLNIKRQVQRAPLRAILARREATAKHPLPRKKLGGLVFISGKFEVEYATQFTSSVPRSSQLLA